MNKMNNKIKFLPLMLLLLTSISYASTKDCISNAEVEYGVPDGLLSVMKGSEPVFQRTNLKFYGPMNLFEGVIPVASKGIDESEDEIKTNPCQNYRAAAWLLMNKYGGNGAKDIFSAVNRYYYGFSKSTMGSVTLNAKKQYFKRLKEAK